MADSPDVLIPMPLVRPLDIPVSADGVLDVWDTFVKPHQAAGIPPSVELRILMAVLRAVHKGLSDYEAAHPEVPAVNRSPQSVPERTAADNG